MTPGETYFSIVRNMESSRSYTSNELRKSSVSVANQTAWTIFHKSTLGDPIALPLAKKRIVPILVLTFLEAWLLIRESTLRLRPA